ncbi:uncharacterized protein FIBRA_02422 [Fibroporia radiculosa]|uniref:Uncharacterized protein n=1 Tax=Fibroporia radiculosa TaxID=599839 RepID=J4HUX5_9APHY|nr:uncharacterized protein FIBRA_02422 [Fibroporia radiculosa]CCM00392.1 predicted protein [Fibroporia radiculosa]
MSYASVAAHNAPPSSEQVHHRLTPPWASPDLSSQPHADPALLTTEPPSASNIADDAAKVNIVSPDFRAHPATVTSVGNIASDSPPEHPSPGAPRSPKGNARKYLRDAEQEGSYLWNLTKHYLFRPSVAGGVLGLLNVGLISTAGYAYYTKPHLHRDSRALASTAAAALLLLSAESYAAEKYSQTPAGQAEERKVKKEGVALYRNAREHLLRPGVLGGLVGLVNASILGTLGYFAYTEWDRPRWDRRIVSAISAGLLTLWSGEGYLAERYRETRR